MANQIQVTVYAIGVTPIPEVITLSFPTKEIIIQEITITNNVNINSQLTYYSNPNNPSIGQIYLIGETVDNLLNTANTSGTSMIKATVSKIGNVQQISSIGVLFPADKPSISVNVYGNINSTITFKGIGYDASETKDALVTAANAGGAGGTPTLDEVFATQPAGAVLTLPRTVELNGNILEVAQNGNGLLTLNPATNNGQAVVIGAAGGTLNGEAKLSFYSNDDDGYGFNLRSSDGTNEAKIVGNAAAQTLSVTGNVLSATLLAANFADDAAAAAGGIAVGGLYHNVGTVRIRLA